MRPMGDFLPVNVSQIAILCNFVCSLERVLYSMYSALSLTLRSTVSKMVFGAMVHL
jgi:hypothetical protein